MFQGYFQHRDTGNRATQSNDSRIHFICVAQKLCYSVFTFSSFDLIFFLFFFFYSDHGQGFFPDQLV